MIDFSKLFSNSSMSQHTTPRDIFMSLPKRAKEYEYPRDVQSEVWKKWYSKKDEKDIIIKMNTGSGKTIVGLLILQSCLNENKGPAVYVAPDNFLLNQVFAEANQLGISATTDPEDIDFIRRKSILIVNIQKLINGKSIFGMRQFNNIEIGSIVIDDIHACLATIENQFTIEIPRKHQLYNAFIDKFRASLEAQSYSKYVDIIETYNPYKNMLVPFWDWQKKSKEVLALLTTYQEDDLLKFSFPLLKDCMHLCNCVICSKSIEITPKAIPIHHISSFTNADRRIYMSATLSDDSAFVTALDIDPDKENVVITPDNANDIGDRIILFPQVINRKITDDEIKRELLEYAKYYNVVVIVPSYRVSYWQASADLIIDTQNIEESISKLKSGHVGLVILKNKYEGIDLPEDSCRILVIDGLPRLWSEFDAYEQNALPKSKRICSELVQKIEQGMGRGVRSNSDYCAVVLMGRNLADVLYTSGGSQYFSEATKIQYRLSESVQDQLKDKTAHEIFDVLKLCLERNITWITASKNALSQVVYNPDLRYQDVSIAVRKAFNAGERNNFAESVAILTELKKNIKSDVYTRGLLKQYIAEYLNFYNEREAQQLLLSATNDNRSLLKPIDGIQFDRLLNKTVNQAISLSNYIHEQLLDQNGYLIKVNALLDKLVFSPESSRQFEGALKEISFLLGIYSTRPEDECGRGPDNFWDIGDSSFLIIECKNETTTDKISKHDCNQLNGSIVWFENLYRDGSYTYHPIMIHNSNIFEFACSPDEKIRIMTPELLQLFTDNIAKFALSVCQPDCFHNQTRISELLAQHKLLGKDIASNYTKKFRKSNP